MLFIEINLCIVLKKLLHKDDNDHNKQDRRGSRTCLICNQDVSWPQQQGIHKHLGNKHGQVFQERWQDITARQEGNLSRTQQRDSKSAGYSDPVNHKAIIIPEGFRPKGV